MLPRNKALEVMEIKMLKDPLGEKLASKKGIALGGWTSDPDMVELMAYMGFDWVMFDMMFTSMDWAKVELLIRTAEAAGITPAVRLPAFPWLGNDPAVARNLGRLNGIGAKYVRISAANMDEMRECARVAQDWHKKLMHIYKFRSPTGERSDDDRTMLWPLAETADMIKSYKEIIALPEVKIFGFGMGDASMTLAGSDKPDFYFPALWSYIDDAVAYAGQHDAVIGCNTSYAPTLAEMNKRAVKAAEHGVRVIMLQGAPFLFQIAIAPFLKDVRDQILEIGGA
jgi:HpcH/HpaI aldolase/citrate lyase family